MCAGGVEIQFSILGLVVSPPHPDPKLAVLVVEPTKQNFFFPSIVITTVHMKNIKKETYKNLFSIQVRTVQRWHMF